MRLRKSDLICWCRKDHYFMKPVQALLATVTSGELRARVTTLGGYDVREIGKVAFPV